MQYKIYDPSIVKTPIIDAYTDPAGLTYVSNSSLEHWQGKYWAAVDGTTQGFTEGSTGQQIWLTTSEDAATWSTAVQPFRDGTHCTNPVVGSSLEWQPNLAVVNDELWCTWSNGNYGYISKLTDPDGQWTNHRVEYENDTDVFLSSDITSTTPGRSLTATFGAVTDYRAFFSQNPIVLSSGAVACPVTMVSAASDSVDTPAANSFVKKLKFSGIFLYADATWQMVIVDTGDDFGSWEPFVVEDEAEGVYLYSRSLDMRNTDDDFMMVAKSSDGGETFAPSVSSKMLVPSTRGFARRVSKRHWIMTHIDHPQQSTGDPDGSLSKYVRRNGALFFSRWGTTDFVPGVAFSGRDPKVNYPQFVVGPDDVLRINYTSGSGEWDRRSLQLVSVDPLPSDDFVYVHPRTVNQYTDVTSPPLLVAGPPPAYRFNGNNQVVSQTSLTGTTATDAGVSYTAWLNHSGGSIIMDTRAGGVAFTTNGIAWGSVNFFHGLASSTDRPMFTAAVIDNSDQTVTMYVANGDELTTTVRHFRSASFSGQPADTETIIIDGVVYTFRTAASVDTDVEIGGTLGETINNLVTATQLQLMQARNIDNERLLVARDDTAGFAMTSDSTNIAVEVGALIDGDVVNIGYKANPVSALDPFAGELFEARIYETPLSLANLTYLHNRMADSFGYSLLADEQAPSASPLVLFDAADPHLAEFPELADSAPGARCESLTNGQLRIYGECSAAVELPWGATTVVIHYTLSSAPAAGERFVVASFGSPEAPIRLHISAGSNSLYANDRFVATVPNPTTSNTIVVTVFSHKINIDDVELYFDGKPRCYLGNAFPEGLLPASKSIDYNVPNMSASVALREEP